MPEPLFAIGALAGYSALYAVARVGTAVSSEASAVRECAIGFVETAERSHVLFGGKAAAISQILALAEECNCAGWDGDDVVPISMVVASSAVDFLRALPDGIPLPEIAPEPDGSVSLDWILFRNRLFTLSIGSTARLAYAWIDGADKGHGVARFDGIRIPLRVLQGIQSIVDHGDASLRAA